MKIEHGSKYQYRRNTIVSPISRSKPHTNSTPKVPNAFQSRTCLPPSLMFDPPQPLKHAPHPSLLLKIPNMKLLRDATQSLIARIRNSPLVSIFASIRVAILVSIASACAAGSHLSLEGTALFVHGCVHGGDVVVEVDFYFAVCKEQVPVYCLSSGQV